jgi:hypothetical protein
MMQGLVIIKIVDWQTIAYFGKSEDIQPKED